MRGSRAHGLDRGFECLFSLRVLAGSRQREAVPVETFGVERPSGGVDAQHLAGVLVFLLVQRGCADLPPYFAGRVFVVYGSRGFQVLDGPRRISLAPQNTA